jgi:hypothetical protein
MRKSTGILGARAKAATASALVAAGALGVTLLASTPASAAVNDDFQASTSNGACGVVNFIDFGPGAAGGGDNDDYLVVHDYCSDGHGVKAYAWLDGIDLGTKYNGNGLAGAAVVWDPFKPFDNVVPGDVVHIRVCLVDGANDPTPSQCDDAEHVSVDG